VFAGEGVGARLAGEGLGARLAGEGLGTRLAGGGLGARLAGGQGYIFRGGTVGSVPNRKFLFWMVSVHVQNCDCTRLIPSSVLTGATDFSHCI